MEPLIDSKIPGFRKQRNCTKQVMAFANHIESGFQRKFKTRAVFVDLFTAYNTVWRQGLLLKLCDVILSKKVISLIDSTLSNRFFQVTLNRITSRYHRLNNGLPQGSVLSPLLFSLYVADLPGTNSLLFQFAVDIALVCN